MNNTYIFARYSLAQENKGKNETVLSGSNLNLINDMFYSSLFPPLNLYIFLKGIIKCFISEFAGVSSNSGI